MTPSFHPVQPVALLQGSLVEDGDAGRRDGAGILEGGFTVPGGVDHLIGPVPSGRSRDDAIKVAWKAGRFHKCLATAA